MKEEEKKKKKKRKNPNPVRERGKEGTKNISLFSSSLVDGKSSTGSRGEKKGVISGIMKE